MSRMLKIVLTLGGVALAATAASAAYAQATGEQPTGEQATPKNWSYEIVDGKRVPKGDRKVNADGSWREEIRQGSCVTIKEKSASGEYKETRKCD